MMNSVSLLVLVDLGLQPSSLDIHFSMDHGVNDRFSSSVIVHEKWVGNVLTRFVGSVPGAFSFHFLDGSSFSYSFFRII